VRRRDGGSAHGETRRWHIARRAVVLVCLLVVIVVIAGFPVYVRPQIDPLRHADAILVLGGPGYGRYIQGFQLAQEGWAPNLVISNPNGPRDAWLTWRCGEPGSGYKLSCFDPAPETTKGEGRELRRLAELHGWRTVIVITFRPHVSRARFILEQCFDGQLVMVTSGDQPSLADWAAEYVYQTAGFVRAAVQPEC
jgi:uncharacterized SAM-binding protein YcdF (DUF218 family)